MKVLKKIFFLLFFTSVTFVLNAQNKININGNLIGPLKKSDLLSLKSKGWFNHGHDYNPNQKIVQKIGKNLKGVHIKAFVGTWCHDSKRVIPRLYQILEMTEFDVDKNFEIIGITRGKKTPDNLQEGYNIKKTPTLIFFKNGKEIGRFVEHARKTIEEDILKIIKQKGYKHAYEK